MCVSKTADLSPSFLDNLVATLDRQHRESVKILGQQWLVSKFQIPTDLQHLSKFYGPPREGKRSDENYDIYTLTCR